MTLTGILGGIPTTYKGPGYIRQAGEKFEITILVDGSLDIHAVFANFNSAKVGVLYGEENTFTLTALDGSGRPWTAKRIYDPQPGGNANSSGYVVNANVHELILTGEGGRASHAKGVLTFWGTSRIDYPHTHYSHRTTKGGRRHVRKNPVR